MKVLLLAPETSSMHSYTGGIGVRFEATALGLADLGHEVTVLTHTRGLVPGARSPFRGRVRLLPVELPVPRSPLYPLADSRAMSRLARAIDTFDCVYAPEWSGLAAGLTGTSSGPPVVTALDTSLRQVRSIEGRQPSDPRQRLRDAVVHRLERRQAVGSAVVCGVSGSVLRWSEQLWGPLPRARVVPNFLDIAATRAAGERPGHLPRQRPTVMSTGRVSSWKGSDTLVQAMLQVWRTQPDAELVLAGTCAPAYREELTAIAAGHAGQLSFLGHLPRAELLPLVAGAHVAAFPSRYEAFGIGALEAKALGVPVVATSGHGFDDFCTSGVDGLLVPPDRPDALAAALLDLLSSATRRRGVGEAGRRRAADFDGPVVLPLLVAALSDAQPGAAVRPPARPAAGVAAAL